MKRQGYPSAPAPAGATAGARGRRRNRAKARSASALLLGLAAAWGCAGPPPTDRDRAASALREAETALAVGELEAAAARFREARTLLPGDPRPLDGLARAELERGDEPAALEAIDALERALADRRGGPLPVALARARCDATARRIRGDVAGGAPLVALGRIAAPPFVSCDTELRHALEVEARLRAADAEPGLRAAGAHYRRVLAITPGHVAATVAWAHRLRDAGDADTALRIVSDALAQHPRSQTLIELAVDLLSSPRAAGSR